MNVFQYSDNSGGQGGHSKPAPAPKQAKPTPPATTAAPKPLGPPVYIDDSYGSTNYDEYETDYDQEYVDIEADLDYESHSDYDTAEQSDYDDQNNQQGKTYFTAYCTIALLTLAYILKSKPEDPGNLSKNRTQTHIFELTPNTPLIHTSFTYSKLNMDDFSVLTGLLGYLDIIHLK